MAEGFRTPYDNAVVSKAGYSERPNLGNSPDAPTEGKTQESHGSVGPKPLPINDLHLGTPDKGPGKY